MHHLRRVWELLPHLKAPIRYHLNYLKILLSRRTMVWPALITELFDNPVLFRLLMSEFEFVDKKGVSHGLRFNIRDHKIIIADRLALFLRVVRKAFLPVILVIQLGDHDDAPGVVLVHHFPEIEDRVLKRSLSGDKGVSARFHAAIDVRSIDVSLFIFIVVIINQVDLGEICSTDSISI